MVKKVDFFVSLSTSPGDIQKIKNLINSHVFSHIPLQHVLITPLFSSPGSMKLVRGMKEQQQISVMFDSGGYYVQIGRLTYQELYYPLLQFYRQNQWADIYTLPDYVPTSQDPPALVAHKVEETAKYSRLFYLEMPDALKPKAMGVVQGHTREQVEHCLKTYLDLGLNYIGFGSFGTVGKNSQTNIATEGAVDLAQHVVRLAHEGGAKVHFFGVGVPALVAMIYGTGADSFDSSSWEKSAGFGQIFFPFMRSYNITHKNKTAAMHKGITIDKFNELRKFTEHKCHFCDSVNKLQKHKMYRAIHNLICTQESVNRINRGDFDFIKKIYKNGSPKYKQEYEKWLQPII